MAALEFPSTPSDGDTYAGYVFNAAKNVWQWQVVDPSVSSLSDTIISTPTDGDTLVYDNGDWVNFPSGKILQAVSATKSDTFTTTSASYVDIDGLSVTLTPSSTSSKVLVLYSVFVGQASGAFSHIRLDRNGTNISLGDADGNRERVTLSSWTGGVNSYITVPAGMFLDSPNTTSPITYKLQIRSTVSGGVSAVNRSVRDLDIPEEPRGVSSITLQEVAF